MFELVSKGQPGFEEHLECLLAMTEFDADHNTQNLRHLAERDYDAVFMLLDENGPAAVAAVEDFSAGTVVAKRVLTRTWYRKDHRQPGLRITVKPGVLLRVLFPPQIKYCIDARTDVIFISTETLQRRLPLLSFAKNLTKEWPEWQWRLDDYMRFTCKHPKSANRADCWQNVAMMNLNPASLPLPMMTTDEYRRNFE